MEPFDAIVTEHGAAVLRLCRSRLQPADADDAWSETFISALRAYPNLRADSNVRAWLFTIMHNVFVNQRALTRRDAQNVSIDGDEDGNAAWQISVRAMQQTRVELMEILREVGRLPVDQRAVLVLAAVEEMRYEEIAAVLSIPVGTVMSRLSRAREKLRRVAQGTPSEPSTLKVVK